MRALIGFFAACLAVGCSGHPPSSSATPPGTGGASGADSGAASGGSPAATGGAGAAGAPDAGTPIGNGGQGGNGTMDAATATCAPPCAVGERCETGADCASGVCATLCLAPSCSDGVKNGDETTSDCGGTACAPCPDGGSCVLGRDCESGVCASSSCAKAACDDGVRNGDETGRDCGGSCAPCASGGGCQKDSDCVTAFCKSGYCAPLTCGDGTQNQTETAVDCGGGVCPPCADGAKCTGPTDCNSGLCNGTCLVARCDDLVKNGTESDVDCGGKCTPCSDKMGCRAGADCASGVCIAGVCRAPTCGDAVLNGTETDVDCGGSCIPCADGAACKVASDCRSLLCPSGKCIPASCGDGVQNGAETSKDCGGGCPGCAASAPCVENADCASAVCRNLICSSPSCQDAVVNGGETGRDCGGPTQCPRCPLGQGCATNADCGSGACFANRCAIASVDFDAGLAVETGVGPLCAALADLDGDGLAELIGGNIGENDFSVRRGHGDGTFDDPVFYKPLKGRYPWEIVTGDLDSDGDRDVVVIGRAVAGGNTPGRISPFLNDGKGMLVPAPEVAVPTAPFAAVIADVDVDGHADIAFIDSPNVGLLYGKGDGTFEDPVYLNPQVDFSDTTLYAASLVIADVRGLGRPDLLIGMTSETIRYVNGGARMLTPAPRNYSSWPVQAAADFDHDGHVDELLFDTLSFRLAWGDGKGSFTQDTGSYGDVPLGMNPIVSLADVDADGWMDFVLNTGVVEIYRNTHARGFEPKGTANLGWSPRNIAVGSIDGDPYPDLAVANGGKANDFSTVSWEEPSLGANVTVLRNHGDGTYPSAPVSQAFLRPTHVAVGDLDGDGDLDAAVSDFNEPGDEGAPSMSIFLYDRARVASSFNDVPGQGAEGIVIADFDADGDQDIATANVGDGAVTIYENGGDGHGVATQIPMDGATGLTVVDFDKNGLPDLAVACQGQGLNTLINLGSMQFGAGAHYSVWGHPRFITAADLDRDGIPDLVAPSYAAGQDPPGSVTLVLSTSGVPRRLQVGNGPVAAAAADFDDDGFIDLAIANGDDYDISMFWNDGHATFAQVDTVYTLVQTSDMVAGDLNGDGRPDLALTEYVSSTVTVLFSAGRTFTQKSWTDAFATGIAIADLDKNGLPDIVTSSESGLSTFINVSRVQAP